MNDYARIAAVIRYLEQHRSEQPALAEIAQSSGLSESHFHRLFHRWAGVTPKDFLQCLTAEHAKQRLRQSASVLETALDAGLSGPGRLHDLLVTIEAASPGEIKSGGDGMVVDWGMGESPFGPCTIAWTARGICHLAFREDSSEITAAWPRADLRRNDSTARKRAALIFNAEERNGTTLKAFVRGSEFQLKVWRALLRIPEGCVASYRQLAVAVCGPNAARAVGAACGANPIAYLIPCHRVIREAGIVQGYRWGSARKQAILAREFSKSSAHTPGESEITPTGTRRVSLRPVPILQ
jgi:AraC family transcriptional regulator, regulatory protein of adaptative response / methylated-DNA-[protein]-cysteine methyltransferase